MDPFVFGCLIFGGGAAMMGLHYDSDFRQKFKETSDEEAAYYKKQYYRRMIASGMIALVGVLFMVYRLLPERSITRLWLIGLVLILVGCVVVFGAIDFGSISRLFAIQQKKSADSARELADELARIKKNRREQAGGKQQDIDPGNIVKREEGDSDSSLGDSSLGDSSLGDSTDTDSK